MDLILTDVTKENVPAVLQRTGCHGNQSGSAPFTAP